MKIKILTLYFSSTDENDYIVEEVEAKKCKWLKDSAWVVKDGTWYLYDLRTGLWLMREDSKAFIEAQRNYIILTTTMRRQLDLYKRQEQRYKELTQL